MRQVPNLLTLFRLVLCTVLFAALMHAHEVLVVPVDATGPLVPEELGGAVLDAHREMREGRSRLVTILDVTFVLFLLAYATDVLDGRIARSYKVESDFGRIADPIADKILVLGSLVLLIPLTVEVEGWMAVVVATREFLVTGLRSYAATRGTSVPVNWWGKTKMFGQSFACGGAIVHVAHPTFWLATFLCPIFIWIALVATVASGARYVVDARRALAAVRGESKVES